MRTVTIQAIMGTVIFIFWATLSNLGSSVLEEVMSTKVKMEIWTSVLLIHYGTMLAFMIAFLRDLEKTI